MAMHVSDYYRTDLLSTSDVPEDASLRVTIIGVTLETFNDSGKKIVLELLNGGDEVKRWPLNVTNARRLRRDLGEDAQSWSDAVLTITNVATVFNGEQTRGLRCTVAARPPQSPLLPAVDNDARRRNPDDPPF